MFFLQLRIVSSSESTDEDEQGRGEPSGSCQAAADLLAEDFHSARLRSSTSSATTIESYHGEDACDGEVHDPQARPNFIEILSSGDEPQAEGSRRAHVSTPSSSSSPEPAEGFATPPLNSATSAEAVSRRATRTEPRVRPTSTVHWRSCIEVPIETLSLMR